MSEKLSKQEIAVALSRISLSSILANDSMEYLESMQQMYDESVARNPHLSWQPIATAPKDRAIWGTDGLYQAQIFHDILEFGQEVWVMRLRAGVSTFMIKPTHWRELPELPK
jgi:hypothetical protein